MDNIILKEKLEGEIISLKKEFENMKCQRLDFMQEMILSPSTTEPSLILGS